MSPLVVGGFRGGLNRAGVHYGFEFLQLGQEARVLGFEGRGCRGGGKGRGRQKRGKRDVFFLWGRVLDGGLKKSLGCLVSCSE